MMASDAFSQLKFRDPARARGLRDALDRLVQHADHAPVSVMHVCGSHEQAIAKFGLRAAFPEALQVIMGPGCPVCVTDVPEVDEAVALAKQGVRIASYGDMLRVPGTSQSLADAKAEGANVDVVYSVTQAVDLARDSDEEIVFFASGFETTAVATAAVLVDDPPDNFSVLSAHKYIPPVMEIVAEMPETKIEGFLAAGHAATITEPRVENAFPRCVTREGNVQAQKLLWRVFRPTGGRWRGIAHVPNGNLRLRDEFAPYDTRKRFTIDASALWEYAPPKLVQQCECGDIMAGISSPSSCQLFGKECTPDNPVGACMVSAEGTCRIWHQYGGRPDLRSIKRGAA